ncbi:MAG: DUF951 domain-containing protein [Clostridia bacterium]|nr:DUF951 domain-containing protein [Clostridia bacterium]
MYELNTVLTLKKPHACGGKDWTVARVGADIKLQCLGCGKYVNLTRDELRKRAKIKTQTTNNTSLTE